MKKWTINEEISKEASEELSSYPRLAQQVLFSRGIKTRQEAEVFLNPDYEPNLGDPFLMLNMDKAVERIILAVKKAQKIVIYSDYDADGVCSAIILKDFFDQIGFENYHVHIPDRQVDGYGLNEKTIKEIIEKETNLVITLDCGITDVEEIAELNKKNIDTVILDHHLPPEKLPEACAIVDVKQKDDKYPFKDFSGAGVVFKTVCALIKNGPDGWRDKIKDGWEKWLLDLVALSSVADMVPLAGENRILVHYGMKVLRKTRRIGLSSLFDFLKLSPENINEDDIAFSIAPRINITSRMDHATLSFELMTTKSRKEIKEIIGKLEAMTSERNKAVEKIMKFVGKKIKEEGLKDVIVAGDKEWKPGVLGLAANKLKDKYRKTCVLWGKGDASEMKGSARAMPDINVVDLLNSINDQTFSNVGGHPFAAGFSVREGKEGDLEKKILEAHAGISKKDLPPDNVLIDAEILPEDVNWENYSILEKMGPFGMGNPKPIFAFAGAEVAKVGKFGNGEIHLRLDFEKPNGEKISAISFNNGFEEMKEGQKIGLAFAIEKNTYFRSPELRLRIVDVRI